MKFIEQLLDDFIFENGIATENEIILVTNINGWKRETMMDIIYARTGYRSIEQCVDDGFTADEELLRYEGLIDDEDEDE
jgi:hypothetical protein